MAYVDSVEALEALYDAKPAEAAIAKVARRMTPMYRRWIMASKFCVLSTVGPEGTDGTPRGDDGPVVAELDPQTLAIPDWRGNNRLDSLRNIVRDGSAGLPSAGDILRELTDGAFDGETYDRDWPARAAKTMW